MNEGPKINGNPLRISVGLLVVSYILGEFIGGCDIITEMFEKGELKTLLKNKSLI